MLAGLTGWVNGGPGLLRSSSSTDLLALQEQASASLSCRQLNILGRSFSRPLP